MLILLKTLATVASFLIVMAIPQLANAQSDVDLNSCLEKIQTSWPALKTDTLLEGNTRHNTPCQLSLQINPDSLEVTASGTPLQVNFDLGTDDSKIEQTLLACKVDKEKLHVVFEEKVEGSFEKRDRVQMTLLKRHGKGLSLILSKREMRIMRPAQHTSLICHLN